MRSALASLVPLLLPAQVAAQAWGTLTGTVVRADKTPLVSARVSVVGTDLAALSRTDGAFLLAGVSRGSQTVEIRMIGYGRVFLPVDVKGGDTVYVRVTLAVEPVPLKALEVKGERVLLPAMQGFEERRARGTGHFFNRAEIARMQPRLVTDVLRRVPGVMILAIPGPFGSSDMVRMARTTGVTGGRPCPVLFYVDGTPFPLTGDVAINQYIAPEDVAAIEVYNGMSQIPPQFQASLLNARCGVIVIWTRTSLDTTRAP